MPSLWLSKVLDEVGILSLWNSPRDAKILCVQRFIRPFAYGSAALVLVSYLDALAISKTQIGLFMTLTLVGDTFISFFLTLFADGVGRRFVLGIGALLMAASGVIFAVSGNFWILLVAAVFGVISPSGYEIGPFRAIEESTLAQLTPPSQRTDIFAWYSFIGTAANGLGMVSVGWILQYLREGANWDMVSVYRAVFWLYAILGFSMFLSTLTLSDLVEAQGRKEFIKAKKDGETAPLLAQNGDAGEAALLLPKDDVVEKPSIRSMIPEISPESRTLVANLCLLFGVDSFATGLAALSWFTFFFKSKFNLPEGTLGTIFFATQVIAAFSMIVASSIAKRFGNVKTMVFTHLPSSIFLSLVSVPNTLPPALVFLILRHCTASMDGVPRQAFLSSVILPSERTAVMGVINVVKTLAQCLSPFITGVLAEKGMIGWAFVLAGALKASYDFGILFMFLGVKSRELPEEEDEEGDEETAT